MIVAMLVTVNMGRAVRLRLPTMMWKDLLANTQVALPLLHADGPPQTLPQL